VVYRCGILKCEFKSTSMEEIRRHRERHKDIDSIKKDGTVVLQSGKIIKLGAEGTGGQGSRKRKALVPAKDTGDDEGVGINGHGEKKKAKKVAGKKKLKKGKKGNKEEEDEMEREEEENEQIELPAEILTTAEEL